MTITTPNGDDACLPGPTAGGGPWPGVVVQESAAMSHDPRNQAYWLASEGYLAAGVVNDPVQPGSGCGMPAALGAGHLPVQPTVAASPAGRGRRRRLQSIGGPTGFPWGRRQAR